MTAPARHGSGFTLIELSIVIVVIALIAGGVLVGRELIEAARMRSQISQFEQFGAAASTFKIKYGCLPGDCARAESLGLGTAGGPGKNGNGNGQVYYTCGSGHDMRIDHNYKWQNFSPEHINFWHQLARASLIQGSYAGSTATMPSSLESYIPRAKWPPDSYVYAATPGGIWANDRNVFFVGRDLAATNSIGSPYTAQQAKALDTKIDNGLPGSGRVKTSFHFGACLANWGSPDYNFNQIPNCTNLATDATIDYLVTSSNTACQMYIGNSF